MTQQKHVNTITFIQAEEHEITAYSRKAKIMFDYFCKLVSTKNTIMLNFDLQSMFHESRLNQEDVHTLQQPWTKSNIRTAVATWKNNKSSSSDGYTGKFYNTFLDSRLPDLTKVFKYVNIQPTATLHPLNDSYIVLVPKKEPPLAPTDCHPISLINEIQMIYSMIMATKLKPLLDKLLLLN